MQDRKSLRDRDTGHYNSYVVVLQYGNAQINAEEVVDRYKGKPDAIETALSYRWDLTCHRLSAVISLSGVCSMARPDEPVVDRH